jgi:hypothetical protein
MWIVAITVAVMGAGIIRDLIVLRQLQVTMLAELKKIEQTQMEPAARARNQVSVERSFREAESIGLVDTVHPLGTRGLRPLRSDLTRKGLEPCS